jgi:membrane-bound ClpP family serine protease
MSANHDDEHPIHLPQPSFSPPLLGLGVMLLAFGVLVGPVLLVVGGVILVIGIATWLIDDARVYASSPEPTDGAHH